VAKVESSMVRVVVDAYSAARVAKSRITWDVMAEDCAVLSRYPPMM